jgi:hypothetical protein
MARAAFVRGTRDDRDDRREGHAGTDEHDESV